MYLYDEVPDICEQHVNISMGMDNNFASLYWSLDDSQVFYLVKETDICENKFREIITAVNINSEDVTQIYTSAWHNSNVTYYSMDLVDSFEKVKLTYHVDGQNKSIEVSL